MHKIALIVLIVVGLVVVGSGIGSLRDANYRRKQTEASINSLTAQPNVLTKIDIQQAFDAKCQALTLYGIASVIGGLVTVGMASYMLYQLKE